MANLEPLSNSLSNDTNFVKIGPVVFDMLKIKDRPPGPFWPKIEKFWGPYLLKPWSN